MRIAGFYKRRLPQVGQPPRAAAAPAGRVPRNLVVRPTLLPARRVWLVLRPLSAGVPLITNPDRLYGLRVAVGTRFQRSANGMTLWALRASDAMSVPSNISFFQGEDLELDFTLTPPKDMTGWTLTSSVKDKLGGTLQFNPTVTITDAGRGLFKAVWPRGSTSALAPGDYVWDVRRTDAGSNTVLAHGEATCKQPVTA